MGKKLAEVFESSNYSSSTLECLKTRRPVVDMYQNYLTSRGKKISSISSSYPLIEDDRMVGVITITKDMTRFNEMMRVFKKHDIKEGEDDGGVANFVFDDIIGDNRILEDTLNIAKTAARTKSNILLYGETGTGKELYAQSIHNGSGANGRFVSINCAAIPENLLEGMLFGTSKGAYTGAVDQPGLFEEAIDGTLFLDELNSMSLNLQSKLLRAVETGKIRRVGETKEKLIRPRIVTALNIHPFEAIDRDILRRDLYYRLGVVTVSIPPLRERKDDIPLLLDFFIGQFNSKYNRRVEKVSDQVLALLMGYDWPGNVRELEHTIEHSMIIGGDKALIEIGDLPSFIREELGVQEEGLLDQRPMDYVEDHGSMDEFLEKVQHEMILDSLRENDGNVAKTAKKLGLNRQTLDYRIKKFNIEI